MGDHFGIGLRNEGVALLAQFVAQAFVVLDDAVVHDGDGVARKDRMGVVSHGRAVGRPAGVGDAGVGGEAGFANLFVEVGHARYAARAPGLAVDDGGDAAGVVAAIFEATQAFDQNRHDVTPRYCTDDATHVLSSRKMDVLERLVSRSAYACFLPGLTGRT